MSFINNPLGSGGTSYQGLGDLTAGVTALQRAEAQRRIEEIQQQKGWEHDEKIANEKWALEIGSTPRINDIRVGLAKKGAADAENMIKSLVDFEKSAPNMSAEQRMGKKMDIVMQQKKLLAANQNAKDMASAVEKMHLMVLSTRPKLSGSQLAEFDKQVADFSKKLSDPDESPKLTPYDAILAVQPPDPPVAVVFNETAKELIPFVDKAVKEGANGREIVDEEAFMKSIKTSTDPNGYLFQKGVEENRWKTPEEMYGQLADKVRTSIGIKPTGRRPLQGKEADVVVEIPTYVESVDPKVMSGEGVSIPRSGRAFSVTIGQGEDRTAAKFTPTQYVDGVLQGEFKGVKYVTREGVDAVQAKRDAKGDSRIKLKNERTVGDKRVVDAVYPEVDTWYGSVPYGQVRDEVKDKFPTIDAKYNAEIGAKSAKQTQQRSDITQEQYAKLKKGETYFYQGKEYTKK